MRPSMVPNLPSPHTHSQHWDIMPEIVNRSFPHLLCFCFSPPTARPAVFSATLILSFLWFFSVIIVWCCHLLTPPPLHLHLSSFIPSFLFLCFLTFHSIAFPLFGIVSSFSYALSFSLSLSLPASFCSLSAIPHCNLISALVLSLAPSLPPSVSALLYLPLFPSV